MSTSTSSQPPRPRLRRAITTALAAIVVAAGLFGGYTAGTALFAESPTTTPAAHAGPHTVVDEDDSGTSRTPGTIPTPPPTASTASGPIEPIADEQWRHEAEPDQVTMSSGSEDAPIEPSAQPQAPATSSPTTSTDTADSTGLETDADDTAGDTAAPTSAGLEVSLRVTRVGHFVRAAVVVTPDGAPLGALQIDFGDGNVVSADEAQLQILEDGGSMTVQHEYVPTLTEQPQVTTASVSDTEGDTDQASVRFATQAIAGDDDCATRVAFTVSMAMVDTTETANFLFERGYGQ